MPPADLLAESKERNIEGENVSMMSKTYYFAPLFVVTAFELKICRGKSGTFEIACFAQCCVQSQYGHLYTCPWFFKKNFVLLIAMEEF